MKPEKFLFVDGPHDGKRQPWRGSDKTRMQIYVRTDNKDIMSCAFTTHIYELRQFTDADGTRFAIAFHESTTKNPMQALIKGYHRARYSRK